MAFFKAFIKDHISKLNANLPTMLSPQFSYSVRWHHVAFSPKPPGFKIKSRELSRFFLLKHWAQRLLGYILREIRINCRH